MNKLTKDALVLVRKHVPEYRIIDKKDSLLHRMIGRIMFFNRRYMTNFYTTIGYTTARPSLVDDDREWITIFHEGVHAMQTQRVRGGQLTMAVNYLRPQIFALFASLTFINISFLIFLLFLLPIPSPTRTAYETEAYKINAMIDRWMLGVCRDSYIDHIVSQFTGWNYYIMSHPSEENEQQLRAGFNFVSERAHVMALERSGLEGYAEDIFLFMEEHGLLHDSYKMKE